jgi:hypothetical protein
MKGEMGGGPGERKRRHRFGRRKLLGRLSQVSSKQFFMIVVESVICKEPRFSFHLEAP